MAVPVLNIDVPARRVHLGLSEIVLTQKEFDLLTLMCQNTYRVVSRDEIFDRVWGYNFVGGTKTLDMHMVTLRRKLGYTGSNSPITTVRGLGFRIDTEKVHVEITAREHGEAVSWWISDDRVIIKSGPSEIRLTPDDLTAMVNKMFG